MPRDQDTVGYYVAVTLEFTPVNKYGDKLDGPGRMTYTATVKTGGGLAGIADVLNGLDEVLKPGPRQPFQVPLT